MRTRIVRIGNSQGIRIPKPLLEESGIEDEVELSMENDRLIIRRIQDARVSWEEAFKANTTTAEDTPLEDFRHFDNRWDEKEWKW